MVPIFSPITRPNHLPNILHKKGPTGTTYLFPDNLLNKTPDKVGLLKFDSWNLSSKWFLTASLTLSGWSTHTSLREVPNKLSLLNLDFITLWKNFELKYPSAIHFIFDFFFLKMISFTWMKCQTLLDANDIFIASSSKASTTTFATEKSKALSSFRVEFISKSSTPKVFLFKPLIFSYKSLSFSLITEEAFLDKWVSFHDF